MKIKETFLHIPNQLEYNKIVESYHHDNRYGYFKGSGYYCVRQIHKKNKFNSSVNLIEIFSPEERIAELEDEIAKLEEKIRVAEAYIEKVEY